MASKCVFQREMADEPLNAIMERGSDMLCNCRREDIFIGATVDIVLKKDQPTGKLTRGVVSRVLTRKGYHPRGIKVMLTDGSVGRVQQFPQGMAGL